MQEKIVCTDRTGFLDFMSINNTGDRSQAVQQLATDILSHLFMEDYLQRNTINQHAIGPLV
jgi:hypothetical protein